MIIVRPCASLHIVASNVIECLLLRRLHFWMSDVVITAIRCLLLRRLPMAIVMETNTHEQPRVRDVIRVVFFGDNAAGHIEWFVIGNRHDDHAVTRDKSASG